MTRSMGMEVDTQLTTLEWNWYMMNVIEEKVDIPWDVGDVFHLFHILVLYIFDLDYDWSLAEKTQIVGLPN
uniref:Uncharacterized protein n=1 Tax=Cucumis melo TaxID=3656 RepID=A0A9I9EMF6_CUCME